jgi:predicted transcriptional regulator of viral defense system
VGYRRELRELAFDSHGVVTLRDAASAGVPAVEVRKLASRGALTRLGQGVYRMEEAPADALTEFAAAVALVGGDAVLVDESVLAAHDLAQVNLRRIQVASGDRVRRRLPATIEVIPRAVPADERTDIDGLPAMKLTAAIRASRGRVLTSRLVDAARQADARGLIDHGEAESLISELEQE